MFYETKRTLAGWWLGHPPEKYESQLGWLETQYFWENKKWQPNHQPAWQSVSWHFCENFSCSSQPTLHTRNDCHVRWVFWSRLVLPPRRNICSSWGAVPTDVSCTEARHSDPAAFSEEWTMTWIWNSKTSLRWPMTIEACLSSRQFGGFCFVMTGYPQSSSISNDGIFDEKKHPAMKVPPWRAGNPHVGYHFGPPLEADSLCRHHPCVDES